MVTPTPELQSRVFTELAETMTDGLFIAAYTEGHDIDSLCYLYANPSFGKITGIHPNGCPGTKVDLLNNIDIDSNKIIDSLKIKKVVDTVISLYRGGNKEPFYCYLHMFPLNGSYYVGQIRDVDEVYKSRETLRINQQKLSAIFNSGSEMMALLDPTTYKVLEMNRPMINFLALYRFDVREATTTSLFKNLPCFMGLEGSIEGHLKQSLSIKCLYKQEYSLPKTKDSDYTPIVELATTPFLDVETKAWKYIIVEMRDVTSSALIRKKYESLARVMVERNGLSATLINDITRMEGVVEECDIRNEVMLKITEEKLEEFNKAVFTNERSLVRELERLQNEMSFVTDKLNLLEEIRSTLKIIRLVEQYVPWKWLIGGCIALSLGLLSSPLLHSLPFEIQIKESPSGEHSVPIFNEP